MKVVSEKRFEANSNLGVAAFGYGNHFKTGVADLINSVLQLAKQQGYWPKNAESEKRRLPKTPNSKKRLIRKTRVKISLYQNSQKLRVAKSPDYKVSDFLFGLAV